MFSNKAPRWLRTFDVIVGLLAVVLSGVILVYQELAILSMIFVLSTVLLFIGIARILTGIFGKHLSDLIRALNFVVGMIAMVLAIAALLYPNLTAQFLIYLLSSVLLLNGVARMAVGGFAKKFPTWLRGFLVAVGLLTIVISAVVFMSSDFGFLALILLLSFTFMFNGIARIIQGITGTQETGE